MPITINLRDNQILTIFSFFFLFFVGRGFTTMHSAITLRLVIGNTETHMLEGTRLNMD